MGRPPPVRPGLGGLGKRRWGPKYHRAWGGREANPAAVWMAGAALMGLVVVKLFLVELGNTGTVARIVSFIAIGALLLVLGYVAPAPPRPTSAEVKE